MKKNKLVATVAFLAGCLSCLGEEMSDAELRDRIVWHLAPKCGGEPGHRRPAFVDEVGASNDTSRLARILAEVAQTNDAWYAEMAMWRLEQYGMPAQLPFLYSCATNPAVGTRAVNAILNIEGVTSNSVAVVCGYVGMTNVNKSIHWDHVDVFKRMIGMLGDGNPELKNQLVRGCIQPHALLNNHCPRQLDSVIMSADGSYRFSQRRLSTLRSVLACGLNEFQAPYVTNAINELVAYPEANLPE